MSKWFCHECQTGFEADTGEPVCPNGHKLGSWTELQAHTSKCKLCGFKMDTPYRVRLDKKMPNGQDLVRKENSMAVLEHFAQYHPSVLRKMSKETGIGVSIK